MTSKKLRRALRIGFLLSGVAALLALALDAEVAFLVILAIWVVSGAAYLETLVRMVEEAL